ncbi:MAG: isocitrate lyase/PEP mutase family protein [Acidimicrobiales bacterium]
MLPTDAAPLARAFLDLHVAGAPLLLPNPWDAGSARILESLGFRALATTSSGHAATLGRLDGAVEQHEAVAHAAAIVAATELPVSADLEAGFAQGPEGVAATVRAATAVGLAGCSIEDATGDPDEPIHAFDLAVERVRAASEAAGSGPGLVLTARAEGSIHGRPELDDAIARLQAFQEAGADVLYAPGLSRLDDIRTLVAAVDRPVNVLARPGGPTVPELAEAGVARVSVGGAFAYAAIGALVEAGRELLDQGTYGFWERADIGRSAVRTAFT